MNRSLTNIITINAADNFAEWLALKIKETRTPMKTLAKATGIGRNTLYAYLDGGLFPKLDKLAVIFDYFGETEIKISLKEPNNK